MLSSVFWLVIFSIIQDISLCTAEASNKPTLPTAEKKIPSGLTLSLQEDETSPSLSPPESVQLRPRIINFNIMVAGLSGLGKTTLCEALLDSWTETPSGNLNKKKKPKTAQTLAVQVSSPLEWHDVAANTILRVRIIDTPGFGNKINHQNSAQTITGYIQKCRLDQLEDEQSTNPKLTEERLVHVCLYFLSPGRCLEIDRHFLKHVQHEVPIVPIIAKADTLTNEEIAQYRAMLRKIFQKEKIQIYDFDENASTGIKQTKNNYNRGRRKGEALAIIARDGIYPWGKARSFDPDHSDLKLIRDLLLSEHTERFLEKSQQQYLKYRARRIKRANIVGTIKYTSFVVFLALQLALMDDIDSAQTFKKARKVLVARVGSIFTIIESETVQADDSNLDTEDSSQSPSSEKSSLWYQGKNLGLFGTPLYKDSLFRPKP
jgi:septin family protein